MTPTTPITPAMSNQVSMISGVRQSVKEGVSEVAPTEPVSDVHVEPISELLQDEPTPTPQEEEVEEEYATFEEGEEIDIPVDEEDAPPADASEPVGSMDGQSLLMQNLSQAMKLRVQESIVSNKDLQIKSNVQLVTEIAAIKKKERSLMT